MEFLASAESQSEPNGGLVADAVRLQGSMLLELMAAVAQALLIHFNAFDTLDVAHELQDAVGHFHPCVVNCAVSKGKRGMPEFSYS